MKNLILILAASFVALESLPADAQPDFSLNWRSIGDDLAEYLVTWKPDIGDLARCLFSASADTDAVWFAGRNATCHHLVCSRGRSGCRKCRNALGSGSGIEQVWVRSQQAAGRLPCWRTFQRRLSASLSFNRNWSEYVSGFGEGDAGPAANFWLGLEALHLLTAEAGRRARWELSDWVGRWYWVENANFSVAGAGDKYRASIGDRDAASSSIGQSMTDKTVGIQDNQFSTPESDNDRSPTANCASERSAGWWFGYCTYFNPNGVYQEPPAALYMPYPQMPMCYTCPGCPSPLSLTYSLKTIECMIQY